MDKATVEQRDLKVKVENDAIEAVDIRSLIHVARGRQIMIDSDLAMLYEVETKNLNRAATRNVERFPEDFRFQLTKEELDSLRFQSGTSNGNGGRGGRRYLPYAYTEQGIAMLSSVLRSDVAVQTSISIMRAFVTMRHFLSENASIFERLRCVEKDQAMFQKSTDERFEKVFRLLEGEKDLPHRVFFDGQVFDAYSLLSEIVGKAEREIALVDGYVDVRTLNILAKKKSGVNITVYTSGNCLSQSDIDVFNAQYPTLVVRKTYAFHDRFLILDSSTAYHIGASLKDAGKKCFAINLMQDRELVDALLDRLENTKQPRQESSQTCRETSPL